ncbi:MAG: hypothetical protein ACR2QK_15665 [Acidimicrobiales bacterium]
MAFESNTIMAVSDPSKVASDLNDLVNPALREAGALNVMAAEALTGTMTGLYILSTRWDSLEKWAAVQTEMADRMAAGGPLAELSARYQTQQRIVSEDLVEAGTTSGRFINATRYSVASPPDGLQQAADVTVAGGAEGIRITSVLAGGDMSGHVIGALFLDSLDSLPGVIAATRADAEYMANIAAAGAQLQSRTIFRVIS